MSTVRYHGGFEVRCEACLEWWPLDVEFWPKSHHVQFCKSCVAHLAKIRVYVRFKGRRFRDYQRAGGTMDYTAWRREYNRLWMQADRASKRAA